MHCRDAGTPHAQDYSFFGLLRQGANLTRFRILHINDLRERIRSEQSLPCKKKISLTCTLERIWRAFFGPGGPGSSITQNDVSFSDHIHNPSLVTCDNTFLELRIGFCLLKVVTCDNTFLELRIGFCLLKEITGDRKTAFLSLDGENTRSEFRRNASHVQKYCQKDLARAIRYASPGRNFTDC